MNAPSDDAHVRRKILAHFGFDVEAYQAILSHADVSRTADASLLLNHKKQLYLYIEAKSKLTLGDVKKIASRMGLKVDVFYPPKGQSHYFEDIARAKFREVFPGRKVVNEDDLIFYRTLVPYNPALMLISEVKDGIVYQYDSDSNTGWRPSVRFAYRRIRTS